MKKNQVKTNLQLLVRSFAKASILDIWYQGTTTYTPEYHSISRAVYIALDTGKVYCFQPGDDLGLKIAYGITVKEVPFWVRKQRQLANLIKVSDAQKWKTLLGVPLQSAKVNWNYKFKSIVFQGMGFQNGDYPQNIEFICRDHSPFFIAVTKIWSDTLIHMASHQLTIFFNPETKEAYDKKSK